MSGHRRNCASIKICRNTFGVGIIDEEGKILANEKDVYMPEIGKGIIPHEAKMHHEKVGNDVLQKALNKSKLNLEDIDVISYSRGPGLSPTLTFTADFSTNLSKKYAKPLIGVHHGISHIVIGLLTTGAKDPVAVYLSGGHNSLLALVDNYYRVSGETMDTTCANTFDVIAREMNLPFPGGPEIEKLARGGKYVDLPYVVKGMDLSFAGIQTAAINLLKNGMTKEDVAYSLQETCFAMLVEVTERALAHTEKEEVLLVGGVAANKRLQEMMGAMCKERGAKFFVVPQEYSGDNGSMIGWTGLLAYKSGWKSDLKDKINSKWRIDEVKITW